MGPLDLPSLTRRSWGRFFICLIPPRQAGICDLERGTIWMRPQPRGTLLKEQWHALLLVLHRAEQAAFAGDGEGFDGSFEEFPGIADSIGFRRLNLAVVFDRLCDRQ